MTINEENPVLPSSLLAHRTRSGPQSAGHLCWRHVGRVTMAGLILWQTLAVSVLAQSWETGSRLERILDEADPLSFSEQPLRQGLDSLEEVYRICLFLDRRVDPHQRVTLSTPALPLRDRLSQISAAAGIGCAFMEWGVYLGPADTAQAIATLTVKQQQQIRSGDRTVARRLLADRPLAWPRLAPARQVAEQLCQTYQVRLNGVEEMPWDIWSERSLPEMDFPSALTLLLAGFNSSYQWQTPGQVAQIVPFPERVTLQDSYRLPAGREPPLAQWKENHAGAKFETRGRELLVDGSAEAHQMVRDWVSGRPTRSTTQTSGMKLLTLKIGSATLQQATDYLSKELEVEFEFSPEAEASLSERISLEVSEATLETLLEKLLTPLKLQFQIEGQTIKVSAQPE